MNCLIGKVLNLFDDVDDKDGNESKKRKTYGFWSTFVKMEFINVAGRGAF